MPAQALGDFTQEDIIILGDLNVIFTGGPSINTHTHDRIIFKSSPLCYQVLFALPKGML
jgi:hypothetical protein